MNITKLFSIALLAVGLSQMAGYFFGYQPLRAVGAATTAAPLPIVFSDVQGLETFASSFLVNVRAADGTIQNYEIDPKLYSRLKGAYNRRNVYGAALSYGPRLPEKVWKSVFEYGFCNGGPLAEAFQIDEKVEYATFHVRTKTIGRNDQWDLSIRCES